MNRCARSILPALLLAIPAFADNPGLTGTIYGPDEQPLPDATVYIYTAKVKVGTSPFCPSCYLDCGKRATTGDDGQFKVPSLDPELLFKVLVVAEGFTPVFLEDVDPSAGVITTALESVPAQRLAPNHTLRGRIVDPDGRPVVGATIDPYAIQIPQGTRYGRLNGIDPLTITNAGGEFILTSEQPDPVLSIMVTARGLATQRFRALSAGDRLHELELDYGAMVTGRLMHNNEPVPNAVMGIVSVDRSADRFFDELTIATDESGHFEFANMPPNREFYVYAKRPSVIDLGASEIRTVHTRDNGSMSDIGSVDIVPGHDVAGRVTLSGGTPIPPGTRLMWSRDDMWDAFFYELGSDGSFELPHVPPGEYRLSIRIPGYRLSSRNHSLAPTDGRGLVGTVDNDIDELTILLEPGELRGWNSSPDIWQQMEKLRSQPLQGVN